MTARPDNVLPARRLRIWVAMFAALCAALVAVPAAANNIAARLVAEPAVPGETAWIAIAMEPTDGWHGYWRNPGDAGFGMTLDWTLPEGVKAGEPFYPVPETLVIGDLMNHVFEGPFAVLVPIELPADVAPGTRLPISVAADWLACTDAICVPEQAVLTGSIPVVAREGPVDPRFAEWRAALPAPLLAKGRYEIAGDRLRVAVPVAPGADFNNPHLFLGSDGLADYAAPQALSRSGNWLIVETAAAPGAAADGATDAVLRLDDAGRGLAVELEPGTVPVGSEALSQGAGGSLRPDLLALLVGALIGGILLNVMPCVFPILSLKAMTLARAGGEGARREAVAYSAGVIVTVLSLGGVLLLLRAAGQQVGWAFQLQEPATIVLLLLLATAIAANFAGLFSLSLPMPVQRQGGGAFATGVLAAIAATPCTGPFMAAAMGAALLMPALPAMALFGALGLGLALPFLLLGFVPALRRALPAPGPWMNRFRLALAVPMALTALALLWLCWRIGGTTLLVLALVAAGLLLIALWRTGARQTGSRRADKPALAAVAVAAIAALAALVMEARPPAATGPTDAIAYSEDALTRARGNGAPVFLYFTADWCVTCKVNEAVAIDTDGTRAAFEAANVTVLRGDWTRRDPEITRFLTENDAAGVPLYLWYDASGRSTRLPQVLTPDMLPVLARTRN